jgi:hypothetical protein
VFKVRRAAAAMATSPRGIRTWRRNLERSRAGGSSRRDGSCINGPGRARNVGAAGEMTRVPSHVYRSTACIICLSSGSHMLSRLVATFLSCKI